MQYELFSQNGSSLKTWKELSAPNSRETDGPTQPERPFCFIASENWKEKVTSVRGAYSQRLNAVRHTSGKECSSWPTASARDWKGCYVTLKRKDGKMRGDLLPDAVNIEENGPPALANPSTNGKSQELWATPRADKTSAENLDTWVKRNAEGKVHQQPLPAQVQNWPTPTAMSRPRSEETMEKCLKFRQSKGKNTVPLYLEEKVVKGANGKLNPNWVEQLMGLPVGWTQLPTAWIG